MVTRAVFCAMRHDVCCYIFYVTYATLLHMLYNVMLVLHCDDLQHTLCNTFYCVTNVVYCFIYWDQVQLV